MDTVGNLSWKPLPFNDDGTNFSDSESDNESAVEQTTGVEKQADGVVEHADVEQTAGVVEQTDGVVEQTAGVVEQTAGVVEQTAGVVEQPDDVEEQPDDVEEQPDDVEEQPDDVEEQTDDVEEQTDDVEEQPNDVEEQTADVENSNNIIVYLLENVDRYSSLIQEDNEEKTCDDDDWEMINHTLIEEAIQNMNLTLAEIAEKSSKPVSTDDLKEIYKDGVSVGKSIIKLSISLLIPVIKVIRQTGSGIKRIFKPRPVPQTTGTLI
jgi:hypothetical protein